MVLDSLAASRNCSRPSGFKSSLNSVHLIDPPCGNSTTQSKAGRTLAYCAGQCKPYFQAMFSRGKGWPRKSKRRSQINTDWQKDPQRLRLRLGAGAGGTFKSPAPRGGAGTRKKRCPTHGHRPKPAEWHNHPRSPCVGVGMIGGKAAGPGLCGGFP